MKRLILFIFLISPFTLIAQSSPVPVVVPFLISTPDAHAAGMGDVGVATPSDAFGIYWNGAKLAFAETPMVFGLSYNPVLSAITPGVNLTNFAGYTKLDYNSAFGFNVGYQSNLGYSYTDSIGNQTGSRKPYDMVIGACYSRQLTRNSSLSIGLKYIRSVVVPDLGYSTISNGQDFAFDIGYFSQHYVEDLKFSWGASVNNIGGKINYGGGGTFIPANLRIGASLNVLSGEDGNFTIAVDVNKLLVPVDNNESAFQGLYSSFYDAPDGIIGQAKALKLDIGAEYEYIHKFYFRGGLVYQSPEKGQQRYVTAGLGFKYAHLNFDAAYLFPYESGNPYKQTYHLTISFIVD